MLAVRIAWRRLAGENEVELIDRPRAAQFTIDADFATQTNRFYKRIKYKAQMRKSAGGSKSFAVIADNNHA